MPYNPNPLIQQQISSQTLAATTSVIDRESGKTLFIQYPSFNLMMSGSSLSLRADLNQLPQTKLIALLKCFLILQSLPERALEEAIGELKEIADFHTDRFPQSKLPAISGNSLRGIMRAAQIRPPIVLGP